MHPSAAALLSIALFALPGGAQAPDPIARAQIDTFNRAFADATRHMDNAATLALWDDDGTSLLPSTRPIIGKAALTKFLTDVTSSLPAAHMELFESSCSGIEISGPWASEYCTEHQVVVFADNRPRFDGRGTMLLVLHRGADGHWRIKYEMWNPAAAKSG